MVRSKTSEEDTSTTKEELTIATAVAIGNHSQHRIRRLRAARGANGQRNYDQRRREAQTQPAPQKAQLRSTSKESANATSAAENQNVELRRAVRVTDRQSHASNRQPGSSKEESTAGKPERGAARVTNRQSYASHRQPGNSKGVR